MNFMCHRMNIILMYIFVACIINDILKETWHLLTQAEMLPAFDEGGEFPPWSKKRGGFQK